MELIDRYVTEVGQHLPGKQRADLEKEIRSLLEDALEDRSQAAGRPADEDMAVELLRQYGPPEKMAASYLPPRYLIGPRWYPNFMLTLRIVLVIVAVATAIGFALRLAQADLTPAAFGQVILETLAGLWNGAMQALGVIVLIFAVIQYALPMASPDLPGKPKTDWDPRGLLCQPPAERVSLPGMIWEIAFTLLVFVLFTFYSDRVGIYYVRTFGEAWQFIPILSQAFFSYLPMMIAVWGLTVARDILVLRQMKWTVTAHWFSTAIEVVTLILVIAMLSGPSLISLDPAQMNLPAPADQVVVEGIQLSVNIVLIIVLVLTIISLFKRLYRLVLKPGGDLKTG